MLLNYVLRWLTFIKAKYFMAMISIPLKGKLYSRQKFHSRFGKKNLHNKLIVKYLLICQNDREKSSMKLKRHVSRKNEIYNVKDLLIFQAIFILLSLIHLDEERILYFKGSSVLPNLHLTYKGFR